MFRDNGIGVMGEKKIRILLPLSPFDGFGFSPFVLENSHDPGGVASESRSRVKESKHATHTSLFPRLVGFQLPASSSQSLGIRNV